MPSVDQLIAVIHTPTTSSLYSQVSNQCVLYCIARADTPDPPAPPWLSSSLTTEAFFYLCIRSDESRPTNWGPSAQKHCTYVCHAYLHE
jgi:hypothetical protein